MTKLKKYDVIIVGAGPAGLNCAKELGGSNLSVLIAEKNSEIGPKVCAGGLTGKSIASINLPEHLLEFKYNNVQLFHKKSPYNLKDKENYAYTINRKELGQWQLQQLKDFSNIEVKTNFRVSKITDKYVIINDEKINYSFLIGADGSSSLVKRYLKKHSKNVGIALQYIIPTSKYKNFEFHFDSKLFSAWYSWVFPHRDFVSIGCCAMPSKIAPKQLRENFSIWLKENNIDTSEGIFETGSINGDYQGYQFNNNVFLAGDAGGFASSLTGEGIYQALVSGKEIGKIILDKNYHSYEIDNLIKLQKKHTKLLNTLLKLGKLRPLFIHYGRYLLNYSPFKKYILKTIA
tara:strand:- start:2785 stop:3822 length:1038 start_codon:yes stop_codon:yes gene_type:complete